MDTLSPPKSMASLETIKNTDDYNKYMQQKENEQTIKLSIMKSSYDTTKDAREAGTTGRDKRDRESAGGYSDLVPITEETKSQVNEKA